ncbi:NIPSNAP family protein [Devosia salina]|uniref:NIPSNAP family protein n=1 Tax=Devosia salina TaxID=2860336 RepID=A0ABX8W820_9HYPH|nr:NIPSNAP family protein [Devosia salina]
MQMAIAYNASRGGMCASVIWHPTLGECGQRFGADLIGHFAPQEGSTSTAYGLYSPPSLVDYQAYRKRLAAGPLGWKNYEFGTGTSTPSTSGRAH